MSVIARKFGSPHMTLYTKGAPEKIKTLSKKETGVLNYITFFIYWNKVTWLFNLTFFCTYCTPLLYENREFKLPQYKVGARL